jgi:hypothetical protein
MEVLNQNQISEFRVRIDRQLVVVGDRILLELED